MQPAPPKLNIEQLLRMGANAARAGNRDAACALFRALSREYPDEPRVWLGLAGVASDNAERQAALEQVLALDPSNEQARRLLARIAPASAPTEPRIERVTPVFPETILTEPVAEPLPPVAPEEPEDLAQEPEERGRFPLLNAIAFGLIIVLLFVIGFLVLAPLLRDRNVAVIPSPTAVLIQPSQAVAPTTGVVTVATPSAAAPSPLPPTSVAPAAAPTATIALPTVVQTGQTTAVAAASTTPSSELALGTVLSSDGWSASLLRPDYALLLDGAIGELQPSGRFVLTLLTVGNSAPEPRRIPADLFELRDSFGRSYSPVPNASTAYLNLYGRGQRGDLALEDPIDASNGMLSIPVIFDVPVDAGGLTLHVKGTGPTGWPVGSSAPPGNVGP